MLNLKLESIKINRPIICTSDLDFMSDKLAI